MVASHRLQVSDLQEALLRLQTSSTTSSKEVRVEEKIRALPKSNISSNCLSLKAEMCFIEAVGDESCGEYAIF